MKFIDVQTRGKAAELRRALGVEAKKKLAREISTAVNATARKVVGMWAKEIGKELAVPQKDIKTTIAIVKKATRQQLSSTVRQKPTSRLSLKRFSARQTNKGVSYRISKSEGRKTIKGAFIQPSLGGHVYRRQGKARLPIVKLDGPSPWGVTQRQKLDEIIAKEVRPELIKQIDRRIRAVNYKRTQG